MLTKLCKRLPTECDKYVIVNNIIKFVFSKEKGVNYGGTKGN